MKLSTQKIVQRIKAHPVRNFVTALLIVLVSVFIWGKVMDGIKVIDPSDPRFNPENLGLKITLSPENYTSFYLPHF